MTLKDFCFLIFSLIIGYVIFDVFISEIFTNEPLRNTRQSRAGTRKRKKNQNIPDNTACPACPACPDCKANDPITLDNIKTVLEADINKVITSVTTVKTIIAAAKTEAEKKSDPTAKLTANTIIDTKCREVANILSTVASLSSSVLSLLPHEVWGTDAGNNVYKFDYPCYKDTCIATPITGPDGGFKYVYQGANFIYGLGSTNNTVYYCTNKSNCSDNWKTKGSLNDMYVDNTDLVGTYTATAAGSTKNYYKAHDPVTGAGNDWTNVTDSTITASIDKTIGDKIVKTSVGTKVSPAIKIIPNTYNYLTK